MARVLLVSVSIVATVLGWAGCVGSPPSDPGGTGSPVPELGTPVSLSIVSESYVDADVHVLFYVGPVEVHRTDLRVPARTTMRAIGPDLATKITVEGNYVEGGPIPTAELIAGQDFQSGEVREYIIPDALDQCTEDPAKREPGVCGCGVADTDTDEDGTPDCIDACLEDSGKIAPDVCGCGVPDVDTDGDGVLDCQDACPSDKDKTSAGVCGCGVPDTDRDQDGTLDCLDDCPNDPKKTSPGACGCGRREVPGCGQEIDECPEDPYKAEPGICGCGVSDDTGDFDGDGLYDCVDQCPGTIPNVPVGADGCPVFLVKADFDWDGDVDQSDYSILQSCLGQEILKESGAGCAVADLDQNGKIDGADVSRFFCYMSGDSIPAFRDCNQNGVHDCEDIQSGTSSDLNGNDIPDECDVQACCVSSTECLDVLPAICDSLGGTPHGAGSTCAQTACTFQFLVACCLPDGSCEEIPSPECSYRGGSFAGSSCAQADCGY